MAVRTSARQCAPQQHKNWSTVQGTSPIHEGPAVDWTGLWSVQAWSKGLSGGVGGGYFPAGDATATREGCCREGDVLDPQQCLDGWEEYNKKIKALQFTWCKRNQASIRVARSPSHGGLTSQLIGLKGSATNALVLDTTGQLQRSYVQIGHVLAQIDLIGI